MSEIKVTDENFQQKVIEKSKTIPVLVDFWASWCGPCQMLGPILEDFAEEYDGKVVVAKMSTEKNQATPLAYDIMSIPAVKLFKDGKVVDEFVGVRSTEDIKEFVDKHL